MSNKIEYNDKTGLLFVITKIKDFLSKKVDKVEGKGLSANDFTDAYKGQLDNLDTALNTKANSANATLTGIPTAPTANEGDNSTQIATTAFVNKAVAAGIASVSTLKFEKVDALPEVGKDGIIYLVPKSETKPQDIYDEYYWTGESFEYMGTTSVDLSGYVLATDLVPIPIDEIEAMFSK